MSEVLAQLPFELLGAIVLGLAAALVWLGARLGRWRRDRGERARTRRNRKIGDRGERVGVRVLERAGYRVLEREVVGHCELIVDGRRERFSVRADAVVQKGRQRYVAEFKGTEKAASLGNRSTRRQVIEYALAYGQECEAVLLVDSEAGTIREIRLSD